MNFTLFFIFIVYFKITTTTVVGKSKKYHYDLKLIDPIALLCYRITSGKSNNLTGGCLMAIFIMAMSINPNAKKMHPDLSHQVNESLELFSKNNVKVMNLFATLGRYDYLAIFDAVDQTVAFRVATEINSKGILETETWPVIPYEDFSRLIQ